MDGGGKEDMIFPNILLHTPHQAHIREIFGTLPAYISFLESHHDLTQSSNLAARAGLMATTVGPESYIMSRKSLSFPGGGGAVCT